MVLEPESWVINTNRGHTERVIGLHARESEFLTQQDWWKVSGKEATFREKTLSLHGAEGEGAESRAVRPKAGKARIVLWRFLNTRARGLYLGSSGEPLEVFEQGSDSPEL